MNKNAEIVRYDNFMNRLQFHAFNETDLNLFMGICARMNGLGEKTQVFSYDSVMELVSWDMTQNIDVFHKCLMRMCEKLRHIGTTMEISEGVFASFNLFDTFRGDKKKRTLTVRVNGDFAFILNEITAHFTRFELSEYISLDGRYTKMIYQRLKQFRSTGWWKVSLEDIRHELDVPSAYKTMHVMDKVIKPALAVIRTCKGFEGLEVEVLRSPRRGRAVEGYLFKWTADQQVPGQLNIQDVLEGQQGKQTGKTRGRKRNRFNEFRQNEYTPEEMDALEKALVTN